MDSEDALGAVLTGLAGAAINFGQQYGNLYLAQQKTDLQIQALKNYQSALGATPSSGISGGMIIVIIAVIGAVILLKR